MTQTPSNVQLASQARQLVRGARTAALTTVMRQDQAPYGSLVASASEPSGAVILLLSDLAEHSQNLAADPRASILLAAVDGLEDPLTGMRVTLQGRVEKSTEPGLRQRFLNRHPDASGYIDFGDFSIYRLVLERVHLVAGFGIIRWLSAPEYLFSPAPELSDPDFEQAVLQHMNDDHGAALDALAGDGEAGWQMTGLDGEGIDLRRAAKVARIAFKAPIRKVDEVRPTLVELTRAARAS